MSKILWARWPIPLSAKRSCSSVIACYVDTRNPSITTQQLHWYCSRQHTFSTHTHTHTCPHPTDTWATLQFNTVILACSFTLFLPLYRSQLLIFVCPFATPADFTRRPPRIICPPNKSVDVREHSWAHRLNNNYKYHVILARRHVVCCSVLAWIFSPYWSIAARWSRWVYFYLALFSGLILSLSLRYQFAQTSNLAMLSALRKFLKLVLIIGWTILALIYSLWRQCNDSNRWARSSAAKFQRHPLTLENPKSARRKRAPANEAVGGSIGVELSEEPPPATH